MPVLSHRGRPQFPPEIAYFRTTWSRVPCGTSAAITRDVFTTTHTEKMIMKTVAKSGLKVRSAIKAGGLNGDNHSRSGLKVRSSVKAGKHCLIENHNRRLLA